MNQKLILVAEKRERLISRAAAQRSALGREIEPWRVPLALTDRGLVALRYIRNHPKWMFGGMVLLVILRPRIANKWLGRALLSWQVLGRLRSSTRASEFAR